MNTLSRIVYTSNATQGFDEADLASIISSAQAFNGERQISGVLMFGGGRFLQLLEGDGETIDQLYHDRIIKDPRHDQCKILLEEETIYRLFPKWTMGRLAMRKGDRSSSVAWATLCEELYEHCPQAQGQQDKAIAYLAGFIQSFGDELDQASMSAWLSSTKRQAG